MLKAHRDKIRARHARVVVWFTNAQTLERMLGRVGRSEGLAVPSENQMRNTVTAIVRLLQTDVPELLEAYDVLAEENRQLRAALRARHDEAG